MAVGVSFAHLRHIVGFGFSTEIWEISVKTE